MKIIEKYKSNNFLVIIFSIITCFTSIELNAKSDISKNKIEKTHKIMGDKKNSCYRHRHRHNITLKYKYKKAFLLYKTRKFDKAIAVLKKENTLSFSKRKRYIKNILILKKYLKHGEDSLKIKDKTQAINSFTKALSADSKIARAHFKYIKSKIAKLYFDSSKEALINKEFPKSYHLLVKAKKYDISRKYYNSILNKLKEEAKEIYLKGYQLKNSDPEIAKSYFKLVISMLPEDNFLLIRAQKKLKILK